MSKKTVFVLGAGASSQFGFPTGIDLLKKVIHDTELDTVFALRFGTTLQQLAADFREALYYSGLSSVDAFLQLNPTYLPIGKLLIGWQILKCENLNKLLMITEKDVDVHRETDRKNWYREIWRRLSFQKHLLLDGRISFITFNYDRSLERFLEACFQHSFYGGKQMDSIGKEQLRQDLAKIEIIHIYGQLGFLDWQAKIKQTGKQEKDVVIRPYGPVSKAELVNLQKTCEMIDLVRKGGELPEGIGRARNVLRVADKVYFLGFGFDETNMELLGVSDSVFSSRQVIGGTTLGLGKAEIMRVESYFPGPKELASLAIDEYLREKIDWVSIIS